MVWYRDENGIQIGGVTIQRRYPLHQAMRRASCWWPRKKRYHVLVLALLLLLVGEFGPYVYSRAMSRVNVVEIATVEMIEAQQPRVAASAPGLRIVAYNIAHGRGLSESNWNAGTAEERLRRLAEIGDLFKRLDADVVVLNEVDFNASWSDGMDQAAYLAEVAGYRYRATIRNLDFQIGLWSWRFGNAVLSRHPIGDAREIDLPSYARWETLMAGKKRALFCEFEIGDERVGLVATHLSHRSEDLRVRSAERLIEFEAGYDHPLIIAGDLNSTPTGFPDSRQAADGRNAIDVIDQAQRFTRLPSHDPGDPAAYTFPADKPVRFIDWILVAPTSTRVKTDVQPSFLSDHRPVIADIVFEAE